MIHKFQNGDVELQQSGSIRVALIEVSNLVSAPSLNRKGGLATHDAKGDLWCRHMGKSKIIYNAE